MMARGRSTDPASILLITPNLPTDINRNRSLYTLRALARDNKVHLVTFVRRRRDIPKELEELCASIQCVYHPTWKALLNCVRGIFSKVPIRVSYFWSRQMREVVRRHISQGVDLIYAKRMRMGEFVPEDCPVPTIIDGTDCMTMMYERSLAYAKGLMRLINGMEARRLRTYEPRLLQRFDKVILCSEVDKRFLCDMYRQKNERPPSIQVLPNITDERKYRPRGLVEKNYILFSAVMHKARAYFNEDAVMHFYRTAWQRIRTTGVAWYIVGPNPSRAVRALARKDPQIVVTGFVDDIARYIEQAKLVVVPLRFGAGTKFRILHAFLLKRPVVMTSVASEGLGLTGKECRIVDDPEAFASECVRLLEDEKLRRKLGNKAERFVKNRYVHGVFFHKMQDILRSVLRIEDFKK